MSKGTVVFVLLLFGAVCVLGVGAFVYSDMQTYRTNWAADNLEEAPMSNAEAFGKVMDRYFGDKPGAAEEELKILVKKPELDEHGYRTKDQGFLVVCVDPDMSGSTKEQRDAVAEMIQGLVDYVKAPWSLNLFLFGTKVDHLGPALDDADRTNLLADWSAFVSFQGFGLDLADKRLVEAGKRPRGKFFPLNDQHTNISFALHRTLSYAISRMKLGETVQVIMPTDADHDPPETLGGAEYPDDAMQQAVNNLLGGIPKEHHDRLHILVVSIGGAIKNPELFKQTMLNNYENATVQAVAEWKDILPIMENRQKQLVGGYWIKNIPQEMPVFKVPTINDPIELRLEIGLRGPEQANFRGMFEVHDRKTEPSAVEIVSMDPGDDHLVYEFLREDGTSAVNGEGLIAVKREETILVRMHEDPKSPFGDESVDIEVTVGLAPDNNIITLNQESDNLTSRFKRPSWWAENWSKFLWGIPASLLLLILVALWAARVNRRREEEEDAAFYEAQKPQLNGTVTWKGKGYALSGEEPIDVGKLEFRLDTDGNICVRPESDFMVQYDDEEALGLQEVEFLGNVTTQLPNAARVKFYENDPDEDEEDGEGGDGHYMYIRGHISTLAVEEGA